MPGFGSLNTAVSGLNAARAGLIVTGHNVSNVATPGFTRQQTLQNNFRPLNLGHSGRGMLQVGLGTDITAIRQIRNQFLDIRFRASAKRVGFHDVKTEAGQQLQSILGELHGDFTAQRILQDMRDSLNELTINLSALDTRGSFISTAISFVNKMNNIHARVLAYQNNLNDEVTSAVQEINKLTTDIADLNSRIAASKASGDRPNDLLDRRNLALDQLSFLIGIDVYNRVDGMVDVITNGQTIVFGDDSRRLGLRFTGPGTSFVEPVFTNSPTILPYDVPFRPLFRFSGPVNALAENDHGRLKALLVTRGDRLVNYHTPIDVADMRPDPNDPIFIPGGAAHPDFRIAQEAYIRASFNARHAFIPSMMIELDTLFHNIITMINEAAAPTVPEFVDDGTGNMVRNVPYMLTLASDPNSLVRNPHYTGPFALDQETQGVEIFSRQALPRFGVVRTAVGVYEFMHIPPGFIRDVDAGNDPPIFIADPAGGVSLASRYTLGNIVVNPIFSTVAGYTMLTLAGPRGIEDAEPVLNLLNQWTNNFMGVENQSVDSAYRQFVVRLGNRTQESETELRAEMTHLNSVDNDRKAVSAVSLDEEMTAMMRFQHSYNAAARMLSVIDSMIETIVMRLGAGRG